MQPTETQNTIASQIAHLKPEAYRPGVDVGFGIVGERTLTVFVPPLHTVAVVTYNEGSDLYDVTVSDATPTVREYSGIYCDQLGDLIFGADAGRWTLPTVVLMTWDDDGNAETVVI